MNFFLFVWDLNLLCLELIGIFKKILYFFILEVNGFLWGFYSDF